MRLTTNPEAIEYSKILKRPAIAKENIFETIKNIFDAIEKNGDQDLKKYTLLYDKILIEDFKVSTDDINKAENDLDDELKSAIKLAKFNIHKFHSAQITQKIEVETSVGVHCWQEKRPIQKVGLYIPGGTAPLFSTVLMLAIPAVIAGCKQIVLCTPPNNLGKINPAILYAAKECGITEIFSVGGIQSIAAMTFGTETIPKVYKIFGPGNQFVTNAKEFATKYGVAIDMPAGPSELMIVADDSAIASFVAADLLSQAEHGVDSQVVLVTTSKILVKQVLSEIELQIEELPRKDIAKKALQNSNIIVVDVQEQALDIINDYAPEHLIICLNNDRDFLKKIENAGSIFIGNYTPESAGDYASGTNHTLPTNGFAKNYSGVNLNSFMKSITFQEISKTGIQNIGKAVKIMANAEGLQAHANAINVRLQYLKTNVE
jgi:histidinol dehydrogenase